MALGDHLTIPVGASVADAERLLVLATLAATGSKPAAAKLLGMSLKCLYNKLHQYRGEKMRKDKELATPTSCLNKAANDEPVFVLRAKDPHAASAVEYWAKQAEASGLHAPAKCAEARQLASEMRDWCYTNIAVDRPEAAANAANRFEG